ncbi:MAG TPA: glycosyltransferase [Pyrinomonadaceae bacterium]|nr:glycosyltransferase [Pyrinomonadaceae bacterium]
MKTLYVCYFGLREPLVQTQVLPYLRALATSGLGVYLLTFEPEMKTAWSSQAEIEERERLAAAGINWSTLPYHKTPTVPATLFDIVAGARAVIRLVQQHGIDVIHARAHIPLAMALLAQRVTARRLVFDLRGLMAEEYADAGIWAEGSLKFRGIKNLEKAGLKEADQIVVLTRAMRDYLVEHQLASADKIEVIPCCVDFDRYTANENERESAERFEVIYAGSVSGLYLLDEMGRFFEAVRAREPRAFLKILTTSPAEEAAARLQRAGVHPDHFWIGKVAAGEVPRGLRSARIGLSFRKPTFSQVAASPTKIPEYLAAGIPVVSNAGVGDVDNLLEEHRVGVVVREFTVAEFERAAEVAIALANDEGTRARCVEVARRNFDLQVVGARGYANVYERIARMNDGDKTSLEVHV